MSLWVDSEPVGDRRWRTVLSGTCDKRARNRLLDEARGLALVGATEVDISIAGVETMDSDGARAVVETMAALDRVGVRSCLGGACGQPELLLGLAKLELEGRRG
jgi:anti-anti-sigma regulatory factor